MRIPGWLKKSDDVRPTPEERVKTLAVSDHDRETDPPMSGRYFNIWTDSGLVAGQPLKFLIRPIRAAMLTHARHRRILTLARELN
jgi:hypothetical protein